MEHARDIEEKITSVNEGILTDLYDDIEQLFVEVNADKKKYDAVFMDMEWENNTRSGVDYVQMLSDMDCRARIVCVTAYTMKYIEKLFWNNVDIFGVINKPVNMESLISRPMASAMPVAPPVMRPAGSRKRATASE